MSGSGSFEYKRKHKLQAETEVFLRPAKRVRLESMLEKLSLHNEPEAFCQQKPRYQVNPLVDSQEPQVKKRRTADLDSIILEKMAEAYKDHILLGLMLIHYCHPLAVLVRHFQVWVKRLFNFFVRKYNERNGGVRRMRPFQSFSRIMALTRDSNVAFTYGDLLQIVLEENVLEAQRLQAKKDKTLDSEKLREIKDGEELVRESRYTYWDKVSKLSPDVDMDVYGGDYYEYTDVEQGHGAEMLPPATDTEMAIEVETPGCLVEANYGNYYGTNYTGFYA